MLEQSGSRDAIVQSLTRSGDSLFFAVAKAQMPTAAQPLASNLLAARTVVFLDFALKTMACFGDRLTVSYPILAPSPAQTTLRICHHDWVCAAPIARSSYYVDI